MDEVRIEAAGAGIARLVLDRAAKHNAMGAAMIAGLDAAADRLAADEDVRVVVLTGEGPTFCAGGDLGWMKEQIAATPEERRRGATALATMLGKLDRLPKPLIGRVQGNAFGGGIGLMSVCDTVIADETALFGLTETRLGLIPATIGPYVVARMGAAKARRVFISGRRFGAAEAVDLGLVARAVAAGELDNAVGAEVLPYLETAPGAVAASKALIRRLGGGVDDAAVAASIDALMAAWEGDEAPEGIAAFFDKRKPRWAQGR